MADFHGKLILITHLISFYNPAYNSISITLEKNPFFCLPSGNSISCNDSGFISYWDVPLYNDSECADIF